MVRASHKEVPDFDRLYKSFTSTLERKKVSRVTTVTEPFSFDERDSKFLERKSAVSKNVKHRKISISSCLIK